MTLESEITAGIVDEKGYPQIMEFVADCVDFHHVFSALRFHEQKRLNGVSLILIEAKSVGDDKKRLYCMLHELAGEGLKIMLNTDQHDQTFVQQATLMAINNAHPILNKYDAFAGLYIRQDIRKFMLLHPQLSQTHPFQPLDDPQQCFYATQEQCQQLEERNIELPSDYYFVELKEQDANQICSEQIYTSQTEMKFVGRRVQSFPGVGAAYKPLGKEAESPGNLACYEYNDGMGSISLLYCQKPHRGKGLGTLVEEKICQRNLRELKIRPYKATSNNRPRVLEMANKSYLWTNCKDSDNNSEIFYVTSWSRTEQPQLFVYEN